MVRTRFAPSPTGTLHLGSARTALFNWLYAQHYKGQFLLRIEDTDKVRSRQEYTDSLLRDLTWLGLSWDEPLVIQSQQIGVHQEMAAQLLKQGHAYRCFCTTQELIEMREKAIAQGKPPLYDRRWRDVHAHCPDRPFSIRLKTPLHGATAIHDGVQGLVTVDNATLDDMVLLRSDGTPTYMLAVVVDDHAMGITHIIRGDDHLTNAFRQAQIYHALGWSVPKMTHIPLIHSADGAKLSKREGALGVDAYREMGILPEALVNALVRLGWSHGNEEKITVNQMIDWFDGHALSKSPARFDEDKLFALNAYYLRQLSDEAVCDLLANFYQGQASHIPLDNPAGKCRTLFFQNKNRVLRIISALAQRSRSLIELDEALYPYLVEKLPEKPDFSEEDQVRLEAFLKAIKAYEGSFMDAGALEAFMRVWADKNGCSFGKLAKPLRLALTGQSVSPSLTEVMIGLGQDWVCARLRDCINRPI